MYDMEVVILHYMHLIIIHECKEQRTFGVLKYIIIQLKNYTENR